MRDRNWQIALFGTFDVENYGDLLFPLIAEAELTERLGLVKLHRFSCNAKAPPVWPYTVTSVIELPEIAGSLDGTLIGGGSIIRFDKPNVPGYGPPTPAIHHPTGYWLTPALIALQHGIPLVWNAPGMHGDNIPYWAEPLMELALANSRYIAVRDKSSQAVLAHFVDKAKIAVLPDTAFGISRLINERHPSVELSRLREVSGLTDPYVIIQAISGLDPVLSLIRNHSQLFEDFRFLVLPIGPILGDHEAIVGDDLPGLVRLPVWPHPLLLAELISQAAAVVGHSYHLAVTALAFGVPVFCSADLSFWKYTALSDFETIFPLPKETEIEPHWFITRLGKTRPSPAARAALDQLAHHWDHIATILREGATATQPALNRFWQSLPNLLEVTGEPGRLLAEARAKIVARDDRIETLQAEIVARDDRIETLQAEIVARDDRIETLQAEIVARDDRIETLQAEILARDDRIETLQAEIVARDIETLQAEIVARDDRIETLQGEIVARDDRIETLYNSPSMRVTAPLRLLMRNLKGLLGR